MKRKLTKKLRLSQIFQYDEERDCYLLPISLENYDELFNGWDAAPLKRKDLEPELLDYIEQVGYDIPLSLKLRIHFILPKDKYDLTKEERSKEAIYNNFHMVIHYISKSLSRNNRKIVSYLLLGLGFLISAYFVNTLTNITFPFSILFEGLFIGGWVMFWEAFSLFFFTGYELRDRRNRFKRFVETEIEFQYFE